MIAFLMNEIIFRYFIYLFLMYKIFEKLSVSSIYLLIFLIIV